MAYFVYAGIMRQPIILLWDTHTVVTNVEVADYWVIILYLIGSVILDSVKLYIHPPLFLMWVSVYISEDLWPTL